MEPFYLPRPADLLEVRGADRVRFVNGYVTCDVKTLSAGTGTYGFVTEAKGHVLADVRVLDLGERLWLDLPAGRGETIATHLGKYAVFDQVEITPLDGWTAFRIVGRPDDAEPYSHAEQDGGRLVREPNLGAVPLQILWTTEGNAPEDVGKGEDDVFERLRIEAGRPLFGRDFGPENFPQETGLGGCTVSYEKGCYLGQEVVARIHYRGGVNRLLRGLRLPDGTESGQDVEHDGRTAGRLTSVTTSERFGRIGLAILHKRVEPGMEVTVGSASATVVDLTKSGVDPFAAAEEDEP